jgi:DNA-binding transcriptional MerR regulator
LDRLGFVRRAKGLGFSLTEIRDLLSVSVGRGCTADVRARAPEKIHDIDDKTRDLQRMRSRLFELLKSCPEEAPHKTARSWRLWWGGQN